MCQDLHLTFWTDPGHGWLEVTQEHLDLVGLKPEHFTDYSYRKGNRFFLEEDCDAPRFLNAAKEAGHTVTLVEEYEEDIFIRELPGIHD
jgi:hypothetical protein